MQHFIIAALTLVSSSLCRAGEILRINFGPSGAAINNYEAAFQQDYPFVMWDLPDPFMPLYWRSCIGGFWTLPESRIANFTMRTNTYDGTFVSLPEAATLCLLRAPKASYVATVQAGDTEERTSSCFDDKAGHIFYDYETTAGELFSNVSTIHKQSPDSLLCLRACREGSIINAWTLQTIDCHHSCEFCTGTAENECAISCNDGRILNPFTQDGVYCDPRVPYAPDDRSFQIEGVTNHSVNLRWETPLTGGFPITDYKIYAADGGQGRPVHIFDVNSTDFEELVRSTGSGRPSVILEGLLGDTNYSFKVQAKNLMGYGSVSEASVSVRTLPVVPEPPGIPQVVDATNTSLTVTWDPPGYDGGRHVSSYILYVYLSPEDDSSTLVRIVPTANLQIDIISLLGYHRYTFEVRAVSAIGHSLASESSTGNYTLPVAPGAPEEAPTIDGIGQYMLNLSWPVPGFNGGSPLLSYDVACQQGEEAPHTIVMRNVLASEDPPFTNLDNLSGYSIYSCRTRATNALGDGAWSAWSMPMRTLPVPPAAPGKPSAATVDQYEIGLQWTAPAVDVGLELSGYRIWKRNANDPDTDWEVINISTFTDDPSVIVKNLDGFTQYYFKVAGINNLGVGQTSDVSDIIRTKAISPRRPDVPTVHDLGPSSFRITWATPNSGGSNVTNYTVELAKEDGTFGMFASGILENELLLEGLLGATLYRARVIAHNGIGPSLPGVVAYVTTLDPVPPNAVLNEALLIDVPYEATLTWAPPEDDGGRPILQYEVAIALESAVWEDPVAVVQPGEGEITVQKLLGATSYIFRLYAVSEVGRSQHVSLSGTTPNPTFPGEPGTPVVINAEQYNITVGWALPEHDGGSRILHWLVMGKTMTNSWSVVAQPLGSTLNETTIQNLAGYTNYSFRVHAVNSIGTGPSSSVSSVVRTLEVPPFSPGKPVTSAVQQYQLHLSWETGNFSGHPITGYFIAKRQAGSDAWVTVTNDTQTAVTEFAIIGLQGYTSYEFSVAGINVLGVGDLSIASDFVQTLPVPPDPPTTLQVSGITHSHFNVQWMSPEFNGGSEIVTYLVEVAGEEASWTNLLNNTAAKLTATITHLLGNASYSVRISAMNGIGVSVPSLPTELKTGPPVKPEPPSSLGVQDDVPYRIILRWSEPSDYGGRPVLKYHISYRVVGLGGVYTEIGSADGDALEWQIENLLGGTSYKFHVTAENIIGVSDAKVTTFTTMSAIEAAAPGTLLVTDVGQYSVALAWQYPEHDGGSRLTGFNIYANTSGTSWELIEEFINASQNTTLILGLMGNSHYHFTVTALNDVGESARSDCSTEALTLQVVPFAPGTPLFSDISAHQLQVTWTTPANDGGFPITGFHVWQRQIGSEDWLAVGNGTQAANTSLIVVGLEGFTLYEFKVAAVNLLGVGVTSISDPVWTLPSAPDPPGAPIITYITHSSFNATWVPTNSRGSAITSYKLQLRFMDNNGSWYSVVNMTVIDMKAVLSGLSGSTLYEVRVTATNSIGESEPSLATEVQTTPPVTPKAPSNLVVTNVAPHTVTLRWSEPSDNGGTPVLQYYLSYIPHNGAAFVLDASTFEMRVTQLLGNCSYEFRVQAVNDIGAGDTKLANHTTLPAIEAGVPGTPHVSDVQQNSVALVWEYPAHDGGSRLTGFHIYASRSGSEWELIKTFRNANGSASVVAGLIGNTRYRFSVTALNDAGEGARSNSSVEIVTLRVPPFAPGKPSFFSVRQHQLQMIWTAPANDGGSQLTRYHVWQRQIGTKEWFEVVSGTQGINTSLQVSGLEGYTVYEYKVAAVNSLGVGDSVISEPVRTLPTPPDPPTAPNISDITHSSFTATWVSTDSRGSAIIAYMIELRDAENDGSWYVVSNLTAMETDALISGLTGSVLYEIRVVASNSIGESEPSLASEVQTSSPVIPKAPSSLTITSNSAHTVTLGWSAPTDNGGRPIVHYYISYAPYIDLVAVLGGNQFACQVDGLLGNTSYDFRVQAVNAVGHGLSTVATYTTLPATMAAPVDAPDVVDIRQRSVTLEWRFPAHDGGSRITGFEIYASMSGGSWKLAKHVTDATENATVINGLRGHTQYQFSIAGVNGVGVSQRSPSSLLVETLQVPPFAPGKPASLHVDQYQAHLNWTAPSNDGGYPIAGYKVWKRPYGTDDWLAVVNDTQSIETHMVVEDLDGDTSYEFVVAGINYLGVGDLSVVSEIVRTLSIPPDAPQAPILSTVTPSSCRISWTPPGNGGKSINHYVVNLAVRAGSWKPILNTTNTTAVLSGLLGGTTYWLRLVASNDIGFSEPGSASSITTLPPLAPVAPSSLVVLHNAPYAAVVQWPTPIDDMGRPVLGYVVSVGRPGGSHILEQVNTETRSMLFSELLGSTTYVFSVRAWNEVGESVEVATKSMTPNATEPAAPTSLLVVDVSQHTASLEWMAPAHDGGSRLVYYKIRAEVDGTWFEMPDFVDVDSLNVTVTSLLGDSMYRFQVQAVNDVGESLPSESSREVRTLKAPPLEPQNLRFANVQQTSLVFLWEQPQKDGGFPIVGYRIWRRDASYAAVGWQTLIENTGTNLSHLVLQGLVGNTMYDFAVAAISILGVGLHAEASQLTAPVSPSAPGEITFVSIGDTWMQLAWESPLNTGGSPMIGYEIMQQSENDGNLTVAVADTGDGHPQHIVTGLTKNLMYKFVVRGWNVVGFSPWGPESAPNRTVSGPQPPAPILSALSTTTTVILAADGTSNDTSDGTSASISNSNSDGTSDDGNTSSSSSSDSIPDGTSDGNSSDALDGVSDGTSDGNDAFDNASSGASGDTTVTSSTTESTADSTADSASDSTTNSTDGTFDGTSPSGTSGGEGHSVENITWLAQFPGAPSAPVARNVQKQRVSLLWNPPAYEGASPIIDYRIWVRDLRIASGSYTMSDSSGGSQTNAVILGLRVGSAISFRVQAANAFGAGELSLPSEPVVLWDQGGAAYDESNESWDDNESGWPAVIFSLNFTSASDGSWDPNEPLCAAPTSLHVTFLAEASWIPSIIWQPPSCTPILYTRLWVQRGGFGDFELWPNTSNRGVKEWNLTSLNGTNTWLSFRLQCVGRGGPGLLSDPTPPSMVFGGLVVELAGANQLQYGPQFWRRPGQPRLGALISGQHLVVSWEGVHINNGTGHRLTNSLLGYQLLRREGFWDHYGGFQLDGEVTNVTSAVSRNLSPNSRYQYAVYAVWDGGLHGLPSEISSPFVPSTVSSFPCATRCGCSSSCTGPCSAFDKALVVPKGEPECVNVTDGCPPQLYLDIAAGVCVSRCPAKRPYKIKGLVYSCNESCPADMAAENDTCVSECTDPAAVLVLYMGKSFLTCVRSNASSPHVQLTFELNYADYEPNDFAMSVLRGIAASVDEPLHRFGVASVVEGSIIVDLVVFRFGDEPQSIPEDIARQLRNMAFYPDPALVILNPMFGMITKTSTYMPTATITNLESNGSTVLPSSSSAGSANNISAGLASNNSTGATFSPVALPRPPLPEPDDVHAFAIVGASIMPLSLAAVGVWWWWRTHDRTLVATSKMLRFKDRSKKSPSEREQLKSHVLDTSELNDPAVDVVSKHGGCTSPPRTINAGDESSTACIASPKTAPTGRDSKKQRRGKKVAPDSFPGKEAPILPGAPKRVLGGTLTSGELDFLEKCPPDPACLCGTASAAERPPSPPEVPPSEQMPYLLGILSPSHAYKDLTNHGRSLHAIPGACSPSHGSNSGESDFRRSASHLESETAGGAFCNGPVDEDDLLDWNEEWDEMMITEVAAPPMRGHAPWKLESWTPRLLENEPSGSLASRGVVDEHVSATLPAVPA